MIHVPFVEPAGPLWVRWKARAGQAQQDHGPGEAVSDDVVRGVRDWLLEAFSGKCAYCELTIHGHAVRVDHFRPKRWIQRPDGSKVKLRERPDPHPGYHWLAYDWRNFLPACERCNLAKSNHFLTENEWWAEQSGELGTERPLLVHPSLEDPGGLLLFKDDGFVYPGASGDARARYVIDTLKLNREELREARAEAWSFAVDQMDALVIRLAQHDKPEQYDRAVSGVEAILDGQAEFSALKRRAIVPGQRELERKLEELRRRERLVEGLTPRPVAP